MNERTLLLGGNTFRYLEAAPREASTDPPLLFLHGLGDTADQFQPIASRLSPYWHLLALDQRGHGGSYRAPDDACSPPQYADDVIAFLDALEFKQAHLFGHSMGGRNALLAAAQYPDRVRSLIIGDIGPEANPDDIEGTKEFFLSLPDSFPSQEEARAHWAQRKAGYSEKDIDILMRNMTAATDGSQTWKFSKEACIAAVKAARERDWWDFLPKIKCPVLFLHVTDSSELSEPVAKRMRRTISNVKYVRIPDSGHNFHFENPVFAAKEIQAFLEGLQLRTMQAD